MELIFALITGFFLSLRWITNKLLLINNDFKWDQIIITRYVISLILILLFSFFFTDRNYTTSWILLLFIAMISLTDFVGTNLTQTYFKKHPTSSFQNFLGSFIPIAYIPIWYFLLWENVYINDLIWILIITICLFNLNKLKEINLKSKILLFLIIWRLLTIFLIWKYITLWGDFITLLIFIYFFVIISYIIKYKISPYKIKKIWTINIADSVVFAIWSFLSFYLFEILKSYEVKIFLLSTFFFNTILFYIFFKENFFLKKLLLSSIIMIWLIIINLK